MVILQLENVATPEFVLTADVQPPSVPEPELIASVTGTAGEVTLFPPAS
jgi:hypothetical protein